MNEYATCERKLTFVSQIVWKNKNNKDGVNIIHLLPVYMPSSTPQQYCYTLFADIHTCNNVACNLLMGPSLSLLVQYYTYARKCCII